jgi:hypothetical protein
MADRLAGSPDRASLGRSSIRAERRMSRAFRIERDFALLATILVAVGRADSGPFAWVAAALVVAFGLVGGARAVSARVEDLDPTPDRAALSALTRWPRLAPALIPAVALAGAFGAVRLVPANVALVPALIVVWLVIERLVSTEGQIARGETGEPWTDRTAVLGGALAAAFIGFVGVAVLVPGGLVEPLPPGAPAGLDALPERALLGLAAADALLAGLLGYRLSVLRVRSGREAAWSAGTYAIVIAIGAGAIRALAVPRILGPALLTLLFFLWDAIHASDPARRRTVNWIVQIVALALLGAGVVVLNLQLRA